MVELHKYEDFHLEWTKRTAYLLEFEGVPLIEANYFLMSFGVSPICLPLYVSRHVDH